ncbi:threonine/serine dehydratase [Paracoccaceae bacterium]|nr:threonine/serine dehydratase [Paracoccaceae bacterium]
MDWPNLIKTASARVTPYIRQTPVVTFETRTVTQPVTLKLEQLQHAGSFKTRGAFNTLLGTEPPAAGLVAASGGNHGAAVAYAAQRLGFPARVYVPEIAGPAKISLIRACGADLQVVPGAYSNALEQAKAWEEKTGAMQIHAYDAEATVAGQGSCFVEWEQQGLNADTVLIAVGGGGLIAGALGWFQGRCKIVAVEPERCATLHAALSASAPVNVEVSGVAANALGAQKIGTICFDLAQSNGIESVLVSDAAITQAQRRLWQDLRQVVEPAGAAALAAVLSGAYTPEPDERLAVLVCGGNIASDPLA